MGQGVTTAEGILGVRALGAEVAHILGQRRPNRLGLMLYGSVARGTAGGGSDIDILELVTGSAATYEVGNANVTQYEVAHLRSLAEQGSLFLLHLRTDGLVLSDPTGLLERTLDAYVQPAKYSHIMKQVEDASAVLDPAAVDFDSYLPSLARLGIYLLRTVVYVKTVEGGKPTFDLGAIDMVKSDPDLRDALAMRRRSSFERHHLVLIRRQLAALLKVVKQNPYSSVEALAVAQAHRTDLVPLFTAVLRGDVGVDYSALTLPPF